MARLKYLLAFFALIVCVVGIAGAYYYWKKSVQPEIDVNRHISGKGSHLEKPDLGKRHFDAAVGLLKEGELVSARDRMLYLMQYFPESATCREAKRIVGEVNMDLLLSRVPMPGKAEHTVRRGEALITIASRSQTTIDYIMRANGKTSEYIFPDEVLIVFPLDFRAEIDLKARTLTLFRGEDFFKEYAIVDDHLPADLKAPVSTSVGERVAWYRDKPVNFIDPNYMGCAKWLRTGRMGLFIRQADPVSDGTAESRPYGVMIANADLEEVYTVLRVGSKVDLVK